MTHLVGHNIPNPHDKTWPRDRVPAHALWKKHTQKLSHKKGILIYNSPAIRIRHQLKYSIIVPHCFQCGAVRCGASSWISFLFCILFRGIFMRKGVRRLVPRFVRPSLHPFVGPSFRRSKTVAGENDKFVNDNTLSLPLCLNDSLSVFRCAVASL